MEIYRNIHEILYRKKDSPWELSLTPLGRKYSLLPELGSGHIEYVGDYDAYIWTFADLVFYKPYICRKITQDRYIEIVQIPTHGDETVTHYRKRSIPSPVKKGLNCFVNATTLDIFSKIDAHTPLQCCSLVILGNFFNKYAISLPENFWATGARLLNPDVLYIPKISAVLHQAGEAHGMPPASAAPYLAAKAMEIAALLLEYLDTYKNTCPTKVKPEILSKIEAAKSILGKNLKSPPLVTELAKKLGTNQNRLQAGFRLYTGRSVAGYIRSLRMNKALEILLDPDISISEVARKVGYQSETNFYKNFKSMFAMRPNQMRKLLTGQSSLEKSHRR